MKTSNTQKCFKCRKKDYIQRFCKEKKRKETVKISSLEEEDSENNELLTIKKSQKKEF